MWRVFEKWFGLEPLACPVCEVLRDQLDRVELERKELLQRVLAPPSTPVEENKSEPPVPITPAFTPWRVRKELLEAEDRKKAELMRDRAKEIEKLEKELEIGVEKDAPEIREAT